MLSVILNWIYIIATAFCTGYGVAFVVEKKLRYRIQGVDSILMAGLVVLSVYAQTFSLLYKVGALANGILLAACIVILFFLRRQIVQRLGAWWRETSVIKKLLLAILFLLWAYYTSRGVMHFDTDLYHAQCIRWIEEYGVVPGLGNLHERFAYNSSFFPLSALYSMKFLVGRSLHTMSGFFALLLSSTTLQIAKSRKKHCFALSGFARASAIYYLTTIVDEVVSPATDYPVMCVIFFVVIKWLDLLEEKKDTVPYSLLCVICVYALSLKLTAGVILLLVLKPACQLIRERRIKEIALYLGLGVLIAAPWMARTVIISGWLLYPFPKLDLFQVDWKMDAVFIEVDVAQISAWGKALYDIALLDKPVMGWMLIRLSWVKLQKAAYLALIVYGTYKAAVMGKFVYDSRLVECYIWQADYGRYELESYEIDGYTFYKPSVGALTGYELFPAAPTQVDMELRGEGLQDGFSRKQ